MEIFPWAGTAGRSEVNKNAFQGTDQGFDYGHLVWIL